jgi:hypothetical protein
MYVVLHAASCVMTTAEARTLNGLNTLGGIICPFREGILSIDNP